MKMSHVTGTKQEKNGSQDWYRQHEAAHIARIEAQDDAERALVTALATQVGNAVAALPAAAARISKAARLVQRKDVWPMTDGTWLVGSESDSEKAYLVRRGPWTCECADAAQRQQVCKHQLAVWLTVKVGAAYQARYN